MEEFKIKWSKKAFLQYQIIAKWYYVNVCPKAASSFVNGIFETLIKVSKNPTIGMPDVRYNKKRSVQYRSFLSHPKYRIIYRVTKTSIRIVAIQCNLMEA